MKIYLFHNRHWQSLSLTRQVDYFVAVHEALTQQLGPTAANHHFGKSIFLIVTGSNDIINYIESDELRNQTTAMQYLNSMYVTLKGQAKVTQQIFFFFP